MDRPAPAEPGTLIQGFRVERLLGQGSLGSVYDATQVSLSRTVALRLVDAEYFRDPEFAARFERQQRECASLHHPRLVPTYEVGSWAGGRFVAMRYVRGRSLAERIADGSLPERDGDGLLAPVAEALDTVHAAGLVHGAVSARSVLIDDAGRAHLADLGLGREGSPGADRAALAQVVVEAGSAGRAKRGSRGVRALAGMAALLVAGVAIGLALDGEADEAQDGAAPPVAAGAEAFGSDLAPGGLESLGCATDPGSSTPECTFVQDTLGGAAISVPRAGVIRGWAIRGATGELALEVMHEHAGSLIVRGFTQPEHVAGTSPRAFDANLPVKPGDRVGVILGPGATVGMRAGELDASMLRMEGGLPGSPERPTTTSLDGELQLRADIEFGARPEPPPGLAGERAAEAEAGRTLAAVVHTQRGGRTVRLRLVHLGETIAIDLFRDGRRAHRIEVEDAEAEGDLVAFQPRCGTNQGFCLRWANGSALPVIHEYVLTRSGRGIRPIG